MQRWQTLGMKAAILLRKGSPPRLQPQPPQSMGPLNSFCSTLPMALWCVLLPAAADGCQSQPHWLNIDGEFSPDPANAWTVADPQTAAIRLPEWITLRDWDPALLQRLRLEPIPHTAPALIAEAAMQMRRKECPGADGLPAPSLQQRQSPTEA